MKTIGQFLAVGLLLLAGPAFAGLKITDSTGAVALASDGRLLSMGTPGDAMTHIFNARKGTMTMILPAKKVYADGTVQDYCNALKQMQQDAMQGMSDEERKMMEQFMQGMAERNQPKKVEVQDKGPGQTIAGYKTHHYQVYVDGKLYEDLWLSSDPKLRSEFTDFDKLMAMAGRLSSCVATAAGARAVWIPESSEPYQKLMRKGWQLKSVDHSGGSEETEQVEKIEEQNIPASRFEPPAGYKKVSIRQLIEMSQPKE